jgi:hypothetical protein
MAVRTDSATRNCPTWSRIGVVPVVEGDTEKGDKTCASKRLCHHPYTTIKMEFWNIDVGWHRQGIQEIQRLGCYLAKGGS